MSRRNAKTKENDIERFLMNVAETAENALREYWEERDAENRIYAMEYVTRRGLIPICTNLVRILAFVTCPFFVFQQKNPQNTQERHPQKEG